MAGTDHEDFTVLLNRAGEGDRDAQARVWSAAYGELQIMARNARSSYATGRPEVPGATTIVHEAFLKAFGGRSMRAEGTGSQPGGIRTPQWDSRAHFYGSLARAMAQFLVDWKRTNTRLKRGGGVQPAHLGDASDAVPSLDPLTDFDRALREVTPALVAELETLQKDAPEIADVVWLRYMAALSLEDTSAILGIKPRTVSKRWNIGRALLRRRLAPRLGMKTEDADERGAHGAEGA
jgi:DNA-directed RNA polymerase specialized sigma24 family protein